MNTVGDRQKDEDHETRGSMVEDAETASHKYFFFFFYKGAKAIQLGGGAGN